MLEQVNNVKLFNSKKINQNGYCKMGMKKVSKSDLQ